MAAPVVKPQRQLQKKVIKKVLERHELRRNMNNQIGVCIMLQPRSIQSSLGIRDKILSLDYVLILSILILGVTSMFAMYSTDGGEFKYHTNSHILRFLYSLGCFLLSHLFP